MADTVYFALIILLTEKLDKKSAVSIFQFYNG